MKKSSIPALSIAAIAALLVSCVDPVQPPIYRPNPPSSAPTSDPYGTGDGSSGAVNPPAAPTLPGEFPTARPTQKVDEVISPYEPYNVINVEGYKSGELVRDPHNKQIFRVP